MVENQYESNCECVETQKSSGNNNVANEYCQTTTNKTSNSSPWCSDDPIAEAKSLLERSLFISIQCERSKGKGKYQTYFGVMATLYHNPKSKRTLD